MTPKEYVIGRLMALGISRRDAEAAINLGVYRIGAIPRHERPRCGAHARSTGKPCQAPPRQNGRCKLHGGLSTGPKTVEGRQRIAEAQRRRWARHRSHFNAES